MNRKQKVTLLVGTASLILITCVIFLLIETQTKVVRRWIDNIIYDNQNHYLPCEQLPLVSEVEKIVQEHQGIIQQIEAVNPGQVGIEVNTCGTGQNADITFWYATHKDRVAIEQIIGNETFFGVPYNLNNR